MIQYSTAGPEAQPRCDLTEPVYHCTSVTANQYATIILSFGVHRLLIDWDHWRHVGWNFFVSTCIPGMWRFVSSPPAYCVMIPWYWWSWNPMSVGYQLKTAPSLATSRDVQGQPVKRGSSSSKRRHHLWSESTDILVFFLYHTLWEIELPWQRQPYAHVFKNSTLDTLLS